MTVLYRFTDPEIEYDIKTGISKCNEDSQQNCYIVRSGIY